MNAWKNKRKVFMNISLRFLTLVLSFLVPLVGFAGTAFKTGENTSGMTKTCFYNYLGSTYTKTVSNIELCPLNIEVSSGGRTGFGHGDSGSSGGTAFKSGERTTGMTKICFYNYLGSTYTKTVSNIELCPLSIQVP